MAANGRRPSTAATCRQGWAAAGATARPCSPARAQRRRAAAPPAPPAMRRPPPPPPSRSRCPLPRPCRRLRPCTLFFRFLFHLSTDVAAWSGDRLCESGNGLQHDAEPVSRLHTASGGCARLAAVAAAAHLPQWLFAAPAAVAVHPKSFPPCSVAGHMVAPQLWKHWLRGRSVCTRSRVIGSPCQVAVQIIWPWSWCPAQQCMPERADTAVINLIGGPSRAPSDS